MNNANLLFPDETYAIRGAMYEVYREIGNGLREEVYQQCLEREFALRSIPFEAKKELRIFYKGEPIEKTYIPDFHPPKAVSQSAGAAEGRATGPTTHEACFNVAEGTAQPREARGPGSFPVSAR